jgi:nitrite reductase/ring-hydroxylating ferredoxin subunit
MASENEGLLPLCNASEIAPGNVKRVEVAGLPPLAVFNLEGSYFVTDDTCTHGLASLAEGYVEGDQIECPWHNGRFCIKTGEPAGFPVIEAIKTYAVTVVGDDVCIARPAQGS